MYRSIFLNLLMTLVVFAPQKAFATEVPSAFYGRNPTLSTVLDYFMDQIKGKHDQAVPKSL